MAGTADQDAGVDPRFDPMYQRGYDPKLHRRPARAPEPAREHRSPPTPPLIDPVQRRAPATEAAMTEAEIAEPLPRNPFRLALLVTSLVAIAGGGLALWHRLTDNQDGSFDTEHVALFVQQLLDALLGPLLTGGLIGLCLWLALGAVRRRDDA